MKVMQFLSVEPMTSRGGNPLANQQIMSSNLGQMFVSYGTNICYKSNHIYQRDDGTRKPKYIFDEYYWNYSRTTSKYRNEFLGFGVNECRKGIKEGWIELTNLNKKS